MENKNTNLILIIILSVVCVLLLGFMLLVMFGNKVFNVDNDYKIILDDKIAINTINKIDIDVKNYDVIIKESKDEYLYVKAYGNDKSFIVENNNTYSLKQATNVNIFFDFSFKEKALTLEIPKSYINDINIKSISGDISINMNLDSNLKLKTTSGDIKVDQALNIDVTSTSGEIEIDNAKDTIVSTVSGDVEINKAIIKQINTTSGEVEIDDAQVINKASIKTVSGDVKIKKLNDCYVEFKTTSGDQSIINTNRMSNNTLIVETVSGDLNVN